MARKIIAFDEAAGKTEEDAQTLETAAWVASVKKAVHNGGTAKNAEGGLITDLTGYTDEQIATFKIAGKLEGLIIVNGDTIRFAVVNQAYEQEPPKWYLFAYKMQELEAAGYLSLVGYPISDLPDDWLPPSPFE